MQKLGSKTSKRVREGVSTCSAAMVALLRVASALPFPRRVSRAKHRERRSSGKSNGAVGCCLAHRPW